MNILAQRPLTVLAAGLACLAVLAGTAARAETADHGAAAVQTTR